MTTATLALANVAGRCDNGFAPIQHPQLCTCHSADEWHVFVAALRQAIRPDSTVHQCDVRPLIRNKVAPKHVGTFYRRAKSDGLIADTGEREQSNDVAGRNTDKLDRIYRWSAAA